MVSEQRSDEEIDSFVSQDQHQVEPDHELEIEYSAEVMETVRKNDITSKMIPYLDKHLIIPLLEFLSIRNVYPQRELLHAKFDIAQQTGLIDYCKSLWIEINNCEDESKISTEFEARKEQLASTLAELEKKNTTVAEMLEKSEVVQQLRQDKTQNLTFLREKYGLTSDLVENIYKFGKAQYESGNYAGAADLLYHFRALSFDAEKNAIATWGKLASEILYTAWSDALQEMSKLREHIDNKVFNSSAQQLLHRTWLLHWSLFPFFNCENGREALCEMFFSAPYLNTIQTCCPWLLRYLTVAIITLRSSSKSNESSMSASAYHKKIKELIYVIAQERYEYSDPIIDFVSCLYNDYDFEKAQKCLFDAEPILQHDFFLVSLTDEFLDSARQLIAECYCKIHHRINIESLAKSIDFTPDQVIRLIHDEVVDLYAKIDIKEGTIVFNKPTHSVYQQVIEKTKGIVLDGQVMAQLISKRDIHETIEA